MKKVVTEQKLGSNEEGITETEAYFMTKDKWINKKVITLERNYVDEYSRFLPKKLFFHGCVIIISKVDKNVHQHFEHFSVFYG